MKILKFGGTSVGSAERMKQAVEIILRERTNGDPLIVVCSAMFGITNHLIELAHFASQGETQYQETLKLLITKHTVTARALFENDTLETTLSFIEEQFTLLNDIARGISMIRECTPRSKDLIMSFGERISCFLMCELLRLREPSCVYLDARHVVKTDHTFGDAQVDFEQTGRNIRNHPHANAPICVVTGFIASTDQGETTTLGRGGSDYTASIFGAALCADEIQIWTDVDGILTADPRVVSHAKIIPHISYEEAMELSHFGAKVIYPPTIQPALESEIPIRIKNTMRPNELGTLIDSHAPEHGDPVTGLSAISDVSIILLHGSGMVGVVGTAARMFSALAKEGINIILITQGSSEHSICVAIQPKDTERAKELIHKEFELEMIQHKVDPIVIEAGLSVVAIVGDRMCRTTGISGRLFGALGRAGVNVVAIAQGSSERNISVVVSKDSRDVALNAIHQEFFWRDDDIHVFLAGVGLIGSTLILQIQNVQNVVIHAICDSQNMLLDQKSIKLPNWKTQLEQNGNQTSISEFVKWTIEQPFARKVFVDCTASEELPMYYEQLLESGVHVVTPNKKAASGKLDLYKRLRAVATELQFMYHTNVGAGLPIIKTIQELLATGDEVSEIRGVFSGTMSYLFNTFDGSKPFSEIVREAKEKGYTEPDPRDDLSGTDVARKLLILAREIGMDVELENVQVENLALTTDEEFAERLREAKEKGTRLRYVGQIKDGKLSVALTSVAADDPLFGLSGSDNLVVIYTKRYNERPFVVRGPGAGAEVTAAGVLRDILSCK